MARRNNADGGFAAEEVDLDESACVRELLRLFQTDKSAEPGSSGQADINLRDVMGCSSVQTTPRPIHRARVRPLKRRRGLLM